MLSVYGWAADPDATCYYRCYLPIGALQKLGLATGACGTMMSPKLAAHDVIVGQRQARVNNTHEWARMARAGKPLVFELDDNIWALPESNPAKKLFWDQEGMLGRLEQNLCASTCATASTEPLAKIMRQFCPDVTVLPNYIDPVIYRINRPQRSNITIGWAGSPTHRDDLAVAARSVRKVLGKYRLTDLHLMGVDYRWLFGRGRFTMPIANIFEFYQKIDFDIGIAPLVDDEFNRSKSHLKCLEYAALGIPVVASKVEPYTKFVLHGITGFLAETPAEWVQYLTELVKNTWLRKRMGEQARDYAKKFDITLHASKWLAVYERALATRLEESA